MNSSGLDRAVGRKYVHSVHTHMKMRHAEDGVYVLDHFFDIFLIFDARGLQLNFPFSLLALHFCNSTLGSKSCNPFREKKFQYKLTAHSNFGNISGHYRGWQGDVIQSSLQLATTEELCGRVLSIRGNFSD